VIVHASLPPLGGVSGEAESVVGALLATCETVVMPAFTSRCTRSRPAGQTGGLLAAEPNPEGGSATNFFEPGMPVDAELGPVAEVFRLQPGAGRSMHPLLSFAGMNANDALEAQTLDEPFGPVGWLCEYDGDVLLIGVDHTANVSLHYAERLAGRHQFTRWAMTPEGAVECPGFPGCSQGFQAISERLDGVARRAPLGTGMMEAVPLRDLINIAAGWIREDPRALLCDRPDCVSCSAVRATVRRS